MGRFAGLALVVGMLACSSGAGARTSPPPTAALPTAGLVGQPVIVLPLTLVASDDALGWDDVVRNRQATLAMADSVVGDQLAARAPEVDWVLPPRLRALATRNPAVVPDPDRLGSAVLRRDGVRVVPDPLRTQIRTLAGMVGGRYALVPAALIYQQAPDGQGRALLTVVMVDVRTGRLGFRTIASGDGATPGASLERAMKALTPGLP